MTVVWVAGGISSVGGASLLGGVWEGTFVIGRLGFGFLPSYIWVKDGGGISIVSWMWKEEDILVDLGFMGGLGARWNFYFTKGWVWTSWELGKVEERGWDLEVEVSIDVLPLKYFITFSLGYSTITVGVASMEESTSLCFLFLEWCLVYASWPTN